jgi:hypothetical protein
MQLGAPFPVARRQRDKAQGPGDTKAGQRWATSAPASGPTSPMSLRERTSKGEGLHCDGVKLEANFAKIGRGVVKKRKRKKYKLWRERAVGWAAEPPFGLKGGGGGGGGGALFANRNTQGCAN